MKKMKWFQSATGCLLLSVLLGFLISGQSLLGGQDPAKTDKPASTDATKKEPPREAPPAVPAPPPTLSPTEQHLLDNIRVSFKLAPSIDLTIVKREASKLKGLDTVTIEAKEGSNTSRLDFYVTQDNKFALLPARVFDLNENPYEENVKRINLDNAPLTGNKNAKVTIVEYSDFQCPYCSQAFKVVENDVMKQYGNKVKLVYKNFPIPGHPWAEDAAVAGLCAFRQNNDAFWVFYRSFFENQSSITPENIKAKAMDYATTAQLDTKKFEECFDKKLTLSQVKADMAEAQAVGIGGTPLFMINGVPLSGAQPFSSFQRVLDDALKKTSQ